MPHHLLAMERPNNPEVTPKAIGHDYELFFESYWRRGITEQYSFIEDDVLANIDTAIKNGAERMKATAAAIAAKDAHMAKRLANDIPIGKDLNERLWRAIDKHMREKHGVNFSSGALERSHSPDVEAMIIDSDGDEPEGVAGPNSRGTSAVETHNETQVCSICQRRFPRLLQSDLTDLMSQGEPTENSEPNTPVSRPQRVRHAYHPQGLSSPPTPEPDNTPNLVRVLYIFLCSISMTILEF